MADIRPYGFGDENARSKARQAVTRAEGRQRRYLRNLERQELAKTNSIAQIREIRGDFKEYQEELKLRAADERGRIAEGDIYDSVLYEEATKNNTNPDSKSTQSASVPGVDSISGEDAPGDSQGNNLTDDPEETNPFLETAVTICINGTPTTGTIYFRAD